MPEPLPPKWIHSSLTLIVAFFYLILINTSLAQATLFSLSADGQSQQSIVVAPTVSIEKIQMFSASDLAAIDLTELTPDDRLPLAAGSLVQYLQRMTGATFSVEHGNGSHGIAIGLASDFPDLNLASRFNPSESSTPDSLRLEDYLLRSHTAGLQIIGATPQAVENAVWDLLHRFGYRQYFPASIWEIVPRHETLSIDIDTFETPAFISRLIWYGGGTNDVTHKDYHHWSQRNRAVAGFRLNTSHEYWRIIRRHKAAFDAHPEYFALYQGERKSWTHAKFNVTHPDLQKLVIEDAIQWFKDNPHERSKSMDPNDEGGWDESSEAQAIGSRTDQALLLANLVAEAANAHFPDDRYVGMYAYYQHQLPPTRLTPHPHVIISFATRFVAPGRTVALLIDGWRKAGVNMTGIREYYGVNFFDRGLPVQSVQGSSIDYIRESIPEFLTYGTRFFTAESNDNWGMLGLGHYLASRLLWNPEEAKHIDAMVEEFLTLCFGPAREPMRTFYDILNGEQRPLMAVNDGLNRLYQALADARHLAAEDPAILARIDALVRYVHSVELLRDYLQAEEGPAAQAAHERRIRHNYRARHDQLISINDYVHNAFRNSRPPVSVPASARYQVPAANNPWKDETPFQAHETQAILDQGLARFNAGDAVLPQPIAKAPLPQQAVPSLFIRNAANRYFVHAQAGEMVTLETQIYLMHMSYGPAYQVLDPQGQTMASGRIAFDRVDHIHFTAPVTGTYRLLFEGVPNALMVRSRHPVAFVPQELIAVPGRVNLVRPQASAFFRVPARDAPTPIVVAGQGRGERVQAWLIDPHGQEVEHRDQISGAEPHTFLIPASPEDQIWSIRFAAPSQGTFEDVFLTLPPEVPPLISPDARSVFQMP